MAKYKISPFCLNTVYTNCSYYLWNVPCALFISAFYDQTGFVNKVNFLCSDWNWGRVLSPRVVKFSIRFLILKVNLCFVSVLSQSLLFMLASAKLVSNFVVLSACKVLYGEHSSLFLKTFFFELTLFEI